MNGKEYTLEDLVKLHNAQGAAVRLYYLEHCRNHPLRWAIYEALRTVAPFVRWKNPADKDVDILAQGE